MHALILADGDAVDRAALDATWPGWDDGVALVIAADGGARQASGLGLRLDAWVGDADSLDAEGVAAIRAAGVEVQVSPVDKDETDTELAIDRAVAAGADRLTVLGALGGPRADHALANVALLGREDLAQRDVRLVGPAARLRLLTAVQPGARVELEGRVGDLVTLLPLGGDAAGVRTSGLRYPLVDEILVLGRTRGVSNLRTARVATVHVQAGLLLIIEAPATLRG